MGNVAKGSLISMLVGVASKATRRKALRARHARPVQPNHRVELNYASDLLAVVKHCRRSGDDVAAGLRVHWDEVVPTRDGLPAKDGPPPPLGAPLPVPSLDLLLEQAARHFGNIEAVAERLAKLAAQRALGAVDEALAASILRSVGVDIGPYLSHDKEIGRAVHAATRANVELIKSIPPQYLDGIRETVEKAFAAGERFESVAKRIAHIGDVTESRAKFIARDQASKMNSAFNEVRQTAIGIVRYTWSTSHDERVRRSHAALDGTTQEWKLPPVVDGEAVNPGEAINCRCVAIPVIDLSEHIDGPGESEERQAA